MVKSAVTPEMIEQLRNEFRIPSEYVTRVPGDETEPRCGDREIVISIAHMVHGLRFPPSEFLINFFNTYEISPTQLSPNSFALLSVFAWCCEVGCEEFPTMLGVKKLFLIQKGVRDSVDGFGDYHLQTRSKASFLDTSVIDSALKDWKHLWFYVQIPQDVNIPLGRSIIDTKAKNTLTAEEKKATDHGFEIVQVAKSIKLTAAILYEAYEARIPPLRKREDKGFDSEAKPQDRDADDITFPDTKTWIARMKKFSEIMLEKKMRQMKKSGELDLSKAAGLPAVPTRRGRERRAPVAPSDGSSASAPSAATSSGQTVPVTSDTTAQVSDVQQSSGVPTGTTAVPVQSSVSLLSTLPASMPTPSSVPSSGVQVPAFSAPSLPADSTLMATTRTQTLPPSVSPHPRLGLRRKSARKPSDTFPVSAPVSQALASASTNLGKRTAPGDSASTQPPKKQRGGRRSKDLPIPDPPSTNVPPIPSVSPSQTATQLSSQAAATSTLQRTAASPPPIDWPGSGLRITQIPGVNFDETMACNVLYGFLPTDQDSALKAVTGLVPPRAVEECRSLSSQEAFGIYCMHALQGHAAVAGIQLRHTRTLKQLGELREENKKLREENEKSKASSDLEKKLKEAEEKLATLQKNIEQDQKRHSDELEKEKQRASEFQSRAEKARAELDAEKEKSAEEKKTSDSRIQSLEEENETLSGLLSAAETSVVEANAIQADLEKKREEAMREKNIMSNLFYHLTEAIDDLVSRYPQAEITEQDLEVYWQNISDVRGVTIIKGVWKALEGQKRIITEKNNKIADAEGKIQELKQLQAEEYGDGILSVLPKIWAFFEQLKEIHGLSENEFPEWEWFIEAQVLEKPMPDDLKADLEKKVRAICAKGLESDSEEEEEQDPVQTSDPPTTTTAPTSTGITLSVPVSEGMVSSTIQVPPGSTSPLPAVSSSVAASSSVVLTQGVPAPFSQTVNRALGQMKKEKVDDRDYSSLISTRPSTGIINIDDDDNPLE